MSTTSPEERSGRLPSFSSPELSTIHGHGIDILRLVGEQVGLGPRVPGTEPHDQLSRLLERRLRASTPEVTVQEFAVRFRGEKLRCANVIGVFRARESTRETAARAGPILLGTHYDTRPRADREQDPLRRNCPIPGANDGGSGTAVLLHMLKWLERLELGRDVVVAFFDAEDLGNIDGKKFSLGAEYLAIHPLPGLVPEEVVALDMVGGVGMVLDIDAHILSHPPSMRLTAELFHLGASRRWEPFGRDKPERLKYIVSDHYPFARRGIASCILIDIDYPQWHTLRDAPEAISADSLGITEAALSLFLSRRPG